MPKLESTRTVIGHALTRVVVPLWVLAGAVFKLIESNPALLPREILNDSVSLGLNLDVVLAVLIAIEFFIVAAMIFLGRFAKIAAVFMLLVFCGVLLREILAGNASCGCLGANSPSPWTMLGIDGALLALVAWLGLAAKKMPKPAAWIGFGVMTVAGAVLCWSRIPS